MTHHVPLSRITEYLAECRELINRNGWMLQGVFPTEHDEPAPGFVYTVGLTEKGLPELIAVGLAPEVAGNILNELAARMVADGKAPENGARLTDMVEGDYELAVLATDPERAREFGVTLANRFYRNEAPVPVLQIVPPDMEGRWPWQDGFDLGWPVDYPVLGDPPEMLA